MLVVGAYRVEVLKRFAIGMGVRSLTLIGSGWHPPLFREEAKALLGPIETLHPRAVFVTQEDSVLARISGGSLIDFALHSSSRLWTYGQDITAEELASNIFEWSEAFLPEGTFAIRAKRVGIGVAGLSRREIESETGAKISSDSKVVDLEKPDYEVVVVMLGPEESPGHWDDAHVGQLVIWGIRDGVSRGPYNGTSPTERPFFKPVTLDPRLARLMISLSFSGRPPSAIVDPFCGTGGIAIEASLLGIKALASDLDSRMVEGTLANLEWAGGNGEFRVSQSPADKAHELWAAETDCSFVFDPPYGRNAWASEDGIGVLLGALRSASEMSTGGNVCTMLPSSPDALDGPVSDDLQVMGMTWGSLKEKILETGWRVSMSSPVRVHKSLSRLVVLCYPAD